MTLVTALLASLFLAIFFTPVLARAVPAPRRRSRDASATSRRPSRPARAAILRCLTARYEQRPALVARPHRRILLAAARPSLAGIGRSSTTSSAAASCPRWTRAPSCSTTSCPPGPRSQETDRVLRAHREAPARDAGGGELLAPHGRAPRARDRRAEHRRLPGEAQGASADRALEEVTAELRAQDHRLRAGHRRRVPAHPGGPDRGPRLVAAADRDQDLQSDDAASSSRSPTTIEEWLPKVKGVVDVVNQTSSSGRRSTSASIRPKAAARRFRRQDVANLQAAMLDGELASDMIRGDRLVGIRVRYPARTAGTRPRSSRPCC